MALCDTCDATLDPDEAREAREGGRAICDECLVKERAAEQAAADAHEAAYWAAELAREAAEELAAD